MQVTDSMKYLIALLIWWGTPPVIPNGTAPAPKHTAWNILLKEFVNEKGDVAYARFKTKEKGLNNYLDYLGKNAPATNWSHNETLAYYINLYNAATVALILENYPIKSIKDIWRPWGQDRVKVGDKTISLGDIEHKILRKMNEPRIHFAINCASFSCPKLVNEAYTADKMEKQLQAATFNFINDPSKNKITENSLELSAIFKWYKSDFTEKRSLITYLQPYTKITLKEDAKISYVSYDWQLNERK